jgi:hypothetical protein
MIRGLANFFKWRMLVVKGRVRRHRSNVRELDSLWSIVHRNLGDASVDELSADRRFALAYSAALQLSSIAITKAGYRVVGEAHHLDTFKAAKLALGKDAQELLEYFETCRRKRHKLEYYQSGLIKPGQARKLLDAVEKFAELVQNKTKS